MLWLEKSLWLFIGLFTATILGIFFPSLMVWLALFSFVSLSFLAWRKIRVEHFAPKSKAFREIQKIQKKRDKIAVDKHHHINDQIAYIETKWGYNQEQKRIIDRLLQERAYTQIYHRLSASLLPQLIMLVDQCNQKEQKGCKREVTRRIRELTLLMKKELQRKKSERQEGFETTLEVYDHLLHEGK